VAEIEVEELTVNLAAAVPKWTALAPVKLLPEMVTEVPPAEVPVEGLTPVTSGPDTAPTTRVVLAEMGEPPFGECPLPSNGVTLVWVTVRVCLPADRVPGKVSEPLSLWSTRVVPL
jgi:hypothetical protein